MATIKKSTSTTPSTPVYVTQNGNTCLVNPGASLTIYESPTIKEQFIENWHSGQSAQVDLSETNELDTAGVQLLTAIAKKVKDNGGQWQMSVGEDAEMFLNLYDLEWLKPSEEQANGKEKSQ